MVPARSEASIEKAVCAFAKDRGCLIRKMNGLGFAGWPDRLFITPSGAVFWIEFKRPGGKVTPLQAALHSQLRARRHAVYVVDTVEVGKIVVEREL